MEYNNLEKLREELLAEVFSLNSDEIHQEFKLKFSKLIELITFSMITGGEEFFAYFLIQLKRDIKLDFSEPCGTKIQHGGFVIYFNPLLFLECSVLEMQALIKHEIYHILSRHHSRSKELRKKFSGLAVNIAMDISINEYIIYLPVWMPKLQNIKREFNVDLKEGTTMELYAEAIQKAIDRLKKETDKEKNLLNSDNIEETSEVESRNDFHELWNSHEELDGQIADEVIKKLSLNAQKGKVPKSVDELLSFLNKSAELPWKNYLKRFLGTIPSGYKKTVTRRDRRQAERLDLRGKLRRHAAEITVAIDISGSMDDKQIEGIMSEVFAIVKNYPFKLTIIECDSEIRRIYNAKSTRDIKKKVNTRGSTRFSPVFKYLSDNKMKNNILVYFTDGLGEEELNIKPINRNTIWILTGKEEKLSLKNPFGVIKKLSGTVIEPREYEYAPNAIKEHRMLEWSSF
jgi:predicted metal-dependent peptidase